MYLDRRIHQLVYAILWDINLLNHLLRTNYKASHIFSHFNQVDSTDQDEHLEQYDRGCASKDAFRPFRIRLHLENVDV